jgi:S-DNA-T family DNA segregation ATPase FtsK/SpoIIIE
MSNENITIQKIFEEGLAISNGEGLIAPLGIKENGEIEYADYSKINHLIVCGSSGSGKTTFVRTLLTSLMSLYSPDSVKFGIFDSMGVDYMDFEGTPFMLMPIMHDSRKCSGMIGWILSEAERRQKFFADVGNIDEFPDIFMVLDDYAEVVGQSDTQEYLYKLLQIAHRVKIHVIIVTSIVLAKIISTELKVNIPHRISFFLPERRNSQVVIDQDGAEALEFPGEFIAKFYSKTNAFHSIDLSDSEIKKLCDFIKRGEECDEPFFK